jgi:ATP-dependent RNA helicase DeaD
MAGDERTLVFVRTRADTTGLSDKLAGDGFAAAPISGDLAQNQRVRTLEAFRRGSITTLVATDVAARGLDIADVKLVVHVHPPIDAETYTHRSGRTGRAGQKGRSVLLVPKMRERAVHRQLDQAGIHASWLPVPGADAVRAEQHRRIAEHVRGALSRLVPTPRQLELATQLLAEHEPAALVAGLLASITKDTARAPYHFTEVPEHRPWRHGKGVPPPRPVRATAEERRPSPAVSAAAPPAPAARSASIAAATAAAAADDADAADAAEATAAEMQSEVAAVEAPQVAAERPRLAPERRGHARAKPAWHKDRGEPTPSAEPSPRGRPGAAGERGFSRFRINWGFKNGAEPRRILAHICRRGGIDSKMVGSIDMQGVSSTFDVSDLVAASFARRVMRRDPRDPELRITPI